MGMFTFFMYKHRKRISYEMFHIKVEADNIVLFLKCALHLVVGL